MGSESLLYRPTGVRSTGIGRCVANCSPREDRSPGFGALELADDRRPTHCFDGCRVEEVRRAVLKETTFVEVLAAHNDCSSIVDDAHE
jgi:hypothetical protein